MTDGNTYAINKYLNEREDWDTLQEAEIYLDELEARIEELEGKLVTGTLEVKDIKINEDGGATYTFDLDEKASGLVQEEGLKLLLYCGLTKVDIEDVYAWILDQDKVIRPMSPEETQRSKERQEVNSRPPAAPETI